MARRMLFPAGLMILIVVLVQIHEACGANHSHHHCPASSCGNLLNISYPFRLNGDPAICGDQRYNLSCENNQPVLYLYDGRFYVQEIYYNNYTIRLVDSGIRKAKRGIDNDSFIPRYSLGRTNFSSGDPYALYHPTTNFSCDSCEPESTVCYWGEFTYYWTDMVFVNCEKQVNSPIYLDISTCFKNGEVYSSNSFLSHSKRYTYVLPAGTWIRIWELEESCQIEQMSQATDQGETFWPNGSLRDFGCNDFYDAVVSGFMLSWLQVYCDKNITEDGDCYVNDDYAYANLCYRRPGEAGLFLKLLRIFAKAPSAVTKHLVPTTIRDKYWVPSLDDSNGVFGEVSVSKSCLKDNVEIEDE